MQASTPRRAEDTAETVRQARTFDTTKAHYERLGLCRTCAAQAAWGQQLGFSRVNPPCHDCQSLVDTFPIAKPGRWRSSSPRYRAQFSSSVPAGVAR